MTWKEFKDKVEALGIQDDDQILWIDWQDSAVELYKPKLYSPNGIHGGWAIV